MKFVYILEKGEDGRLVILGVWSNKKKAMAQIKKLPSEMAFILTRVPLDHILARQDLKDNLGSYLHWHYGE
jgi:hypothetical protein